MKTSEQIKGANANDNKGFGQYAGERPKTSPRPKTNEKALTKAHSEYEALGRVLGQSSNNRLSTLAHTLVESRKPSVEQFCDVLEMAQSGELDLMLINAEMQRRMAQRESNDIPESFNIGGEGLNLDISGSSDCVALITGFGTAKAIAGV